MAKVGALEMKMADFQKSPKAKIDLFKQGKEKLESEIKNDPFSNELHFIRFIIQEQSPKILKYKSHLSHDEAIIIEHFDKFHQQVQQEIMRYSKSSTLLNQTDFE